MQVYVIDPYQPGEPHFPIVWMVKSYSSLLWNIQLFGLGYFEMTLPADNEAVYYLQEGRMLVRECDIVKNGSTVEYRNAMIIRRVAITYDAEQGYTLTVSGKSIKDILSQRIIWHQTEWHDYDLTTIMRVMIRMNASDPVNYADSLLTSAYSHKTNAEASVSTAEGHVQTTQAAYVQAQIDYDQAVAQYGEDSPQARAAKETMEAAAEDVKTAEAELAAAEADLAEAEQEIVYYTELLSVASDREIFYFDDRAIPVTNPPTVTVQLYGENLGEWCESIATEYGLGWDIKLTDNLMYFVFIQGTDRHTTVEFSPELDNLKNAEYVKDLSVYRNSGLATGEGEGIYQYRAEIAGQPNARRYEEFITTSITKDASTSDLTYENMVKQAGKSEIVRLSKYESITGEIDTDGVYKIGTDFNLGDVVSVKMDFGVSATTRLTEVLYSDEADGTRITGTFEEWEV